MPKIFVIQEHNASHHHRNHKLEIDGVLKSFAIPKTPSSEQGIKRFVIRTKNHPLEYADFEGEIPQEHHSAEIVTITFRDRGRLVIEEPKENEKILFELSGSKMQGRYALIKAGLEG